jgi:hypothetical protein
MIEVANYFFLSCDACINIGWDIVPWNPRIHSLPRAIVLCRRRLPHPITDVPSVSGEQAPKPTSPRVPARVGMYKVFVKRCHILWSAVIFWLWWPLLFYYRCCRRGYTYSRLLMRNKIWFAKDYTQLCAITWTSPTKGLSVCAITWMSPAEGLWVHTNDWTVNPLLCSGV